MDEKIQIAQDRKGASIAFFSATNNATAIYATLQNKSVNPLDDIRVIRNELLKDYNEYYSSTLNKVGKQAEEKEIQEIISRVNLTDSNDTLRSLYLSLRQELRDNKEIRTAVNLKKAELKGVEVIDYGE